MFIHRVGIALIVCCCLFRPAFAETLVGRVVGVTDGDTMTLLDTAKQTHKIRLSGIDAPEQKQPFGKQAKLSLSNLAYGRVAKADCPTRDRYRRAVCVVTVAGQDVGLQQIRQGFAWWYRDYAREQRMPDRQAYERAEKVAQEQRLGLWREIDPTTPWEWRREKRAQSSAKHRRQSASGTEKDAHQA